MIVDAIAAPILAIVQWALGLLPRGEALPLPDSSGLWELLAGFDSLVPIWPVLYAGLGLLSAAVVFVTIRIVLTVWNLIWP
jgi:hypothetical protein